MSASRPPTPPLGPQDEEDVFAKYRRLHSPAAPPTAPPAPPPAPRPAKTRIEKPRPVPRPQIQVAPGTYASTPRRMLAYLLDAVVLSVLLYLVTSLLGVLRGPVVRFQPETGISGGGASINQGLVVVTAGVNAVVSALYFIGSWALWSATPGQRALKIVVGPAGAGELTSGQAAARWLLLVGPLSLGAVAASALPGLRVAAGLATLLWAVVLLVSTMRSPTRQGLHDRVADSVVKPERSPGRPAEDE